MYELTLWDRICMPGRELGTVAQDSLPKVGNTIFCTLLDYEVINIWKCGCKIEERPRYTVLVKAIPASSQSSLE